MKEYKALIGPLVGFVLTLLTAVVYSRIEKETSWLELGVIVILGTLLFIVFSSLQLWIAIKPQNLFNKKQEEYDEFLQKIEASVNKLVQKQRFIDQATLDLIEKQSKDIWVVTTKLESELKNKNLQDSVELNLEKGGTYTYFLPHPDNPYFDEVDRNLRHYKNLPLYKKYNSQIQFIRMPLDTQFLLEEIVIYNPTEDENPEDNTKGLNAFTFYSSKEDEQDSLHMKIEGSMLIHVRNRLEKYITDKGLRNAIDKIIIEYAEILGESENLYLVSLFNKSEIDDTQEHKKFLSNMKESNVPGTTVEEIENLLQRYVKV